MTQQFLTTALTLTVMSMLAARPAHAQSAGPIAAAARREVARVSAATSAGAQTGRAGWVARHPVLTGALAGTVAGLALSRVDAIGGVNHDPRVAFLGTAVGAWGGLIASAAYDARHGRRVGLARKLGIAAGAVTLVAGPWLACYGAGGCGGVS